MWGRLGKGGSTPFRHVSCARVGSSPGGAAAPLDRVGATHAADAEGGVVRAPSLAGLDAAPPQPERPEHTERVNAPRGRRQGDTGPRIPDGARGTPAGPTGRMSLQVS